MTLKGTNTLTVAALGGGEEVDAFAANQTDPAIHVAGGSLTIGGSGKLTLAQRGVAADAEGGAALLGTAAGENLSGSIAIQNSANITATASGGGAAIGTGAGGNMRNSASITILGTGTAKPQVTATTSGGGAAIGTGKGGTMVGTNNPKSSITITGSTDVTATATGGGAAIGTGAGTSSGGGKIAISAEDSTSRPNVTATASDGGAAIGSGAGADLQTEIQITGPVDVDANADGGGAAIGTGAYGDMKSPGRIKISNGNKTQNHDARFSPDIEARVSGGAAAVIGCGENGSIVGPVPEIVIEGTAEIRLWENNPTKAGYVPGAAIGVGGYEEGGTATSIDSGRSDQNPAIDIQNPVEGGGGGEVDTMPQITIHGNGWIGLAGGEEHAGVNIDQAVKPSTEPYPDPEEPEESEEPGVGGGAFTEPEYYPDYEEEEESLPPEATEEEARYMVACRALNVRLGPGTGYGKLGALSRGEIVSGEVTDGWLCFLHDGQAAYCSAEYLIPLDGDGRRVLCRALNVRSGPGVEFAKIGELRRGAVVEVLATADGWHKIEYLGGEGYVSAQYVG